MLKMRFIWVTIAILVALLFTQCGSSKRAGKNSTTVLPKTDLKTLQTVPPTTADNPPPSPVYDVDAKSQPAEIPAPQIVRELAPMEEDPIEVGTETIKTPTKEQEEAMRNKVQKPKKGK